MGVTSQSRVQVETRTTTTTTTDRQTDTRWQRAAAVDGYDSLRRTSVFPRFPRPLPLALPALRARVALLVSVRLLCCFLSRSR
jgi:hypothetical protein